MLKSNSVRGNLHSGIFVEYTKNIFHWQKSFMIIIWLSKAINVTYRSIYYETTNLCHVQIKVVIFCDDEYYHIVQSLIKLPMKVTTLNCVCKMANWSKMKLIWYLIIHFFLHNWTFFLREWSSGFGWELPIHWTGNTIICEI